MNIFNVMNSSDLTWETISNWQIVQLVGFGNITGLIRFRLNGKTMFIGCGASAGGLGARLNAYRSARGTGKAHYAGQRIHEHRHQIELQIAQLDWPPHEIKLLRTRLVDKEKPLWNVPPEHRRTDVKARRR